MFQASITFSHVKLISYAGNCASYKVEMNVMPAAKNDSRIIYYSVAGFFVILAAFLVAGFSLALYWSNSYFQPLRLWSECGRSTANIFIEAGENLQNVKCIALDKELFSSPEIYVGELSRGSKDVCRFELKANASMPLRFEVLYNGKSQREVCQQGNAQFPVATYGD